MSEEFDDEGTPPELGHGERDIEVTREGPSGEEHYTMHLGGRPGDEEIPGAERERTIEDHLAEAGLTHVSGPEWDAYVDSLDPQAATALQQLQKSAYESRTQREAQTRQRAREHAQASIRVNLSTDAAKKAAKKAMEQGLTLTRPVTDPFHKRTVSRERIEVRQIPGVDIPRSEEDVTESEQGTIVHPQDITNLESKARDKRGRIVGEIPRLENERDERRKDLEETMNKRDKRRKALRKQGKIDDEGNILPGARDSEGNIDQSVLRWRSADHKVHNIEGELQNYNKRIVRARNQLKTLKSALGRRTSAQVIAQQRASQEFPLHERMELERLRKEHIGSDEGLKGAKLNRYEFLQTKANAFREEIPRNTFGRTEQEEEQLRINNRKYNEGLPHLPHGITPEKLPEGRIDPLTGKANLPSEPGPEGYSISDVYRRADTGYQENQQEHERTDLGLKEGWSRTHSFNVEQRRRHVGGLISGRTAIGKGGKPPEVATSTIGPNKELVVKTRHWEITEPERAERSHDEFTFGLEKNPVEQSGFNDRRDWEVEGQNLRKTLDNAGVGGKLHVRRLDSGEFKAFTERGEHLNPDQVAALQDALDANHHLKDFKPETVNGPPEPADIEKSFGWNVPSEGERHFGHTAETALGKPFGPPPDLGPKPEEEHKGVYGTAETSVSASPLSGTQQEFELYPGDKSRGPLLGWRNRRAKVPIGASTLPKKARPEDIVAGYEKNIYTGRVGVNLGERDPITEELLVEKGHRGYHERDSVGVVIPTPKKLKGKKVFGQTIDDRVVQKHFREDTDAIGWGTSYRPGEKEISTAALAVPRARQERKLAEAYLADKEGDSEPLERLVQKYHPELETDAERKEQEADYRSQGEKISHHFEEIGTAAAASGYYTAKKNLVGRTLDPIYMRTKNIPKVGSKVEQFGQWTGFQQPYGGLRKDMDVVGHKVRAKVKGEVPRWKHPFSVRDNETGEFDHNSSGITRDEVEYNIPKIKYRQKFINPEVREGRKFEKEAASLKNLTNSRVKMNAFLRGEAKSYPGLKKWNYWQAKGERGAWSGKNLSENLVSRVDASLEKINAQLNFHAPINIAGKLQRLDKLPRYKTHLLDAKKELLDIKEKINASPEDFTSETLEKDVAKFESQLKHIPIPNAVKTGSKYGLYAGAALGATALAVDRYQVYKQNKGQEITHPIVKAVIPETISYPKLTIKRTETKTFPHNQFTDLLDIENKKVPVAWRASVSRKQVAHLRNQRDISNEPLAPNLPLIGGLSVRAPAPVKGKSGLINDVNLPGKNLYIAGQNTHLITNVGNKERWDNKRHRLRAKYNPYKLDQEDREHLVALAVGEPDKEDYIRNFYNRDQRIQEMLDDAETDPEYNQKIRNKNLGWLAGPEAKRLITRPGPADDAGMERGSGMTADQEKAYLRNRTEAQRRYKREGII